MLCIYSENQSNVEVDMNVMYILYYRRGVDDGRKTPETHFKNPRVGALYNKWRQVWLSAMERQRRLQDKLDYLNEVRTLTLLGKHCDSMLLIISI